MSVNPPSPARRKKSETGEASRVAEVYQQILLRIIRGEWSGGAELKSTQLARDLHVSRTPVVQALQRLAADGIVQLSAYKRAVVQPGAENWLVEIHQLRELLEPPAAAVAAVHMPAERLADLRRLAEAARPGAERPLWPLSAREFDFALHLAVADHCGNLALGAAIRKCWSFKELSYSAGSDSPGILEQAFQEHLLILHALEDRDGPTASAAMLLHLRSAAKYRDQRII